MYLYNVQRNEILHFVCIFASQSFAFWLWLKGLPSCITFVLTAHSSKHFRFTDIRNHRVKPNNWISYKLWRCWLIFHTRLLCRHYPLTFRQRRKITEKMSCKPNYVCNQLYSVDCGHSDLWSTCSFLKFFFTKIQTNINEGQTWHIWFQETFL